MTDSNTGDLFEKEKKHMKLIFERAYYLPENNDTEQQIKSVSLKLLELLKEKKSFSYVGKKKMWYENKMKLDYYKMIFSALFYAGRKLNNIFKPSRGKMVRDCGACL